MECFQFLSFNLETGSELLQKIVRVLQNYIWYVLISSKAVDFRLFSARSMSSELGIDTLMSPSLSLSLSIYLSSCLSVSGAERIVLLTHNHMSPDYLCDGYLGTYHMSA